MNRKAAVAWTLYDFANSAFVAVIPATVYSKYYALSVVGNERGEGDFWWALAVTTSMAIVALSSPPLCAIPAFLFLPGDRPGTLSLAGAVRVGFTQTRATLRRILRMPDLRRFLLAYPFFQDGINTVIFFSSIFAGHTLGFTTPEVIQLYFVVQLSALLGAWVWGRPTDFKGPKFVVMVTLVQWCLVVVAAYFVETKAQFFVVAILAGTGLGAVQAASRTFMVTLIPKGQEAELFGFYALVGKTSAIFRPMGFGLASWLTGGSH